MHEISCQRSFGCQPSWSAALFLFLEFSLKCWTVLILRVQPSNPEPQRSKEKEKEIYWSLQNSVWPTTTVFELPLVDALKITRNIISRFLSHNVSFFPGKSIISPPIRIRERYIQAYTTFRSFLCWHCLQLSFICNKWFCNFKAEQIFMVMCFV